MATNSQNHDTTPSSFFRTSFVVPAARISCSSLSLYVAIPIACDNCPSSCSKNPASPNRTVRRYRRVNPISLTDHRRSRAKLTRLLLRPSAAVRARLSRNLVVLAITYRLRPYRQTYKAQSKLSRMPKSSFLPGALSWKRFQRFEDFVPRLIAIPIPPFPTHQKNTQVKIIRKHRTKITIAIIRPAESGDFSGDFSSCSCGASVASSATIRFSKSR